jgi:hypothetical protein
MQKKNFYHEIDWRHALVRKTTIYGRRYDLRLLGSLLAGASPRDCLYLAPEIKSFVTDISLFPIPTDFLLLQLGIGLELWHITRCLCRFSCWPAFNQTIKKHSYKVPMLPAVVSTFSTIFVRVVAHNTSTS